MLDNRDHESLGSWLRRRRKVLDLTQAALADRVGCAEVTIRKWEADFQRPSRPIAERLATCLDIPADERALFLQVARGERSPDRLPSSIAPRNSTSRVLVQVSIEPLPLDQLPLPAPLPPGSRMPLSRNPLFVGRDTDLRQLAGALTVGETAAIGQVEIAAATGLGGIGKTQLACEFVHRYGQFFAGGVCWLSFADPATVPAEVAACGGSAGMQLSPEFDALPLATQIQRVLTAWKEPIPRLLIFDNCEDAALLQQWRPTHGGCRVLLTSRRHHWDAALGVQAVPLDVLPRQESIALLRRFRPDLPADDAALAAIAETLGDLPLALHLAGSFLARYRHALTPAQYLARLHTPTLLDDRSLQAAGLSPTRHVQHVARTFEQSYARLDAADPMDALALTLLSHVAYFAPGEPIPRWLLLQTLELPKGVAERGLLAEDALMRLIDLGLLDTDATGNLRLHRLVVAFVQAVLGSAPAQGAVEATMLQVAAALNQTYTPRPLLAVQPHLRFITEAAQPHADVRTAGLCHALGIHLYQLGLYAESQDCHEQALTIRERVLGGDHPDTADSLNNLGAVCWAQGQYVIGQDYFAQAFAIRQRVLGPDHPDTAKSFHNMGVVLHKQGQYVAAQDSMKQALAIVQQALGPDHPFTAQSLSTLGEMLTEEGHYAAAQDYFAQAVAIKQQVLGPDHPLTAESLNNLGAVLHRQGQYAAAQGYFEQALVIRERVLGADHPDTARSLKSLGEVLHAHGETALARCSLERALAIFEQRLIPQHPDTEQTRQLLAALDTDRTAEKRGS